MAENQPSEPRVDFPGLDLAYERAMASYQEIGARFDAANQRIDGLLTLTSTVTPAAPLIVAATGTGATLRSPLLAVVAGLFATVLLFGVAARGLVGSLTLVGPSDRYEDWLGLGETEFKLDGLYWAGEHFEHGMNVVWRKSLLAHAMTALFAAEVVVLLSWIASEVQV